MRNTYVPYPVRIKDTRVETEDKQLKSFWLEFMNPADADEFAYCPGQFAELSVSGYGEIPIGIASSPTEGKDLLFTVNKVGAVTGKLHNMQPGEVMGVDMSFGLAYAKSQLAAGQMLPRSGSLLTIPWLCGKNCVPLAGM